MNTLNYFRWVARIIIMCIACFFFAHGWETHNELEQIKGILLALFIK